MQIRYAKERGNTRLTWLNSFHTFSFGDYYDAKQMGFGVLRVINDDRVIAGAGFQTHSHRDMEIISYVLEGSLQHNDSLNNGSVIVPGDVQRMSAGTGITHSEFNPSSTENLHFLQIWVTPDKLGYPPSYEQRYFGTDEKKGKFCLIASNDVRKNSVLVHQDISIFAGLFSFDDNVSYTVVADRQVWVHVAQGTIVINQQILHEGDALTCTHNEILSFKKGEDAEVLLFDVKI